MDRAVFTTVHNEGIFLQIWLSYYSKFFEHIYVLNHNEEDGSVQKAKEKYKFEETEIKSHGIFDNGWLRTIARSKQQELLKSFKYVLFAEADEFVMPDPDKYKDLNDYIDQMKEPQVRCTGREIVHVIEHEAPLDLSKPILSQRKHWSAHPPMNKTLLSTVPLDWEQGFHSVMNCPTQEPDPDLIMLHLKRMDWDLYNERIKATHIDTSTSTSMSDVFHQFDHTLEEIPERFKIL